MPPVTIKQLKEMTPTAWELYSSTEFWQRRCRDQLKYIQSIEKSDRRPARKILLQHSALEIYEYCRFALDRCKFMDKVRSRI